MPLNADEALALADFDAEVAAGKLRQPGYHWENRIMWLRRVVSDLKERVDELEAGGVPEVLARKDAIIAARDAHIAKHSERIALLESTKLPDITKYFRDSLPMKPDESGIDTDKIRPHGERDTKSIKT